MLWRKRSRHPMRRIKLQLNAAALVIIWQVSYPQVALAVIASESHEVVIVPYDYDGAFVAGFNRTPVIHHVVTFPFDKQTTQHLTRVAFIPSMFARPRLIVIHAFYWRSGQCGETFGSWRTLRGFSGLALE